jgi:predicted RNA-binding protein with PIN domain
LVGRALEKAVAVAREGCRAEPSVDAPSELQPFLGFRKLTGPARAVVARVLERDDAFRTRVLDSVAEGELDMAAELFLSRPSGWSGELEALAARREAQVGAQEEQRQDHALKRELDRAETRLSEMDELTRRSATEITGLNQELTEVRRARRSLTEDLDAALARTESLVRAADEATRRADEAEAALAVRERELVDARRRLDGLETELERRPPAPEDATPMVAAADLGRSLARLRRAATAVDDALSVTEALMPAPPPVRSNRPEGPEPTDAGPPRRRPTPLPGGIRDDSVEAARHLVRVAGMTVLVDGYNVSMLAWPDAELADQRDRLVTRLEALTARTGIDPLVVFDGAPGHPPVPGRPRQQVRVRFSAADVEADDEILDLVEQIPAHRPVTVVSNDRRVIDGARQRGADVITSTVLLKLF